MMRIFMIQDINVIDTRKKMGLLAQRPCPLPMSIFDNVAYGPRIHGIKRRKAINQTVIQYLQYVGLWDEVRERVRTSATRLSIGQQQRLCLARGLAIEPEYILGDEATSALDPLINKKNRGTFCQAQREIYYHSRDTYSQAGKTNSRLYRVYVSGQNNRSRSY